LKRALVQPHESVRQKLGAFRAQLVPFGFMVAFAVYVNHGVNGFFLSLDSRMLLAHVKLCPFLNIMLNKTNKNAFSATHKNSKSVVDYSHLIRK